MLLMITQSCLSGSIVHCSRHLEQTRKYNRAKHCQLTRDQPIVISNLYLARHHLSPLICSTIPRTPWLQAHIFRREHDQVARFKKLVIGSPDIEQYFFVVTAMERNSYIPAFFERFVTANPNPKCWVHLTTPS